MKYKGVSAKSRWFRLKKGQRKYNLTFRLRGFEEHNLNRSKRVKARQAAWTVNPENRHAYKIIECDSWDDAQAKAQAENAYLVSINDEKEQKMVRVSLLAENILLDWAACSRKRHSMAVAQWSTPRLCQLGTLRQT